MKEVKQYSCFLKRQKKHRPYAKIIIIIIIKDYKGMQWIYNTKEIIKLQQIPNVTLPKT